MSAYRPYPKPSLFGIVMHLGEMPSKLEKFLAQPRDPGQQSLNRTRQGYARKRILKPAGRFFSGYRMEGGRP